MLFFIIYDSKWRVFIVADLVPTQNNILLSDSYWNSIFMLLLAKWVIQNIQKMYGGSNVVTDPHCFISDAPKICKPFIEAGSRLHWLLHSYHHLADRLHPTVFIQVYSEACTTCWHAHVNALCCRKALSHLNLQFMCQDFGMSIKNLMSCTYVMMLFPQSSLVRCFESSLQEQSPSHQLLLYMFLYILSNYREQKKKRNSNCAL